MLLLKVALTAALAALGVNANNEWHNCNKCLHQCVQSGDIRDYASCPDKKDDYCVFMSQEYHEGVEACFETRCAGKCGDLRQIYKNMAEEGVKSSTTLTSEFMRPHVDLMERGEVPGDVDKLDGIIVKARDGRFNCGCGHPDCDCLSPNPTGKCGCGKDKSHAAQQQQQRRRRGCGSSASKPRADGKFSPDCARICIANQVQEQFHLYRMDRKLGDSICNDKTYIPACCADITGHDHEQVSKAIIWVKRFCASRKDVTLIELTDGLDGTEAAEKTKQALAELEDGNGDDK